jgi:cell shape-determining protein MreD
MRRPLATFATVLALWALVSQANHALAPWHVYLWLGGLFVTFSALTLPLRAGLAASLLGGLLCDSTTAVAFGTHTLLFATAHVALFNIRDRVPRDETAGRVVIALLGNLALFLIFSFLQITRMPASGDVWPRLIFDLLCSQVFLALIAPWFFALQSRTLDFVDPDAAAYDRRLD